MSDLENKDLSTNSPSSAVSAPIVSTYRVQLHGKFTFRDATAAIGYLADLGATHLYASPYLMAEKGSQHGYNTVDHSRLNPELGTDDDHRAMVDALRARSMGHIVDIVPNHMGISSGENPWWKDVLENGPASLYSDFFDIDWSPPKPILRARVLLPILGAQYGQALENNELAMARTGGAFVVRYFEHEFPLAPASVLPVLEDAVRATELAESDPSQTELLSIVTALRHLPRRDSTDMDLRSERAREKEVIKRRLAALLQSSEQVARAVDLSIERINGQKVPTDETHPREPRSFDRLDSILRDQSYRLSSWQVAGEEINYRRFFDVNSLAAIRMEDDAVFQRAHALLFQLIREGRLDGLRLDHTDGLYDPAEYFRKLHAHVDPEMGDSSPSDLRKGNAAGLFLLAEKILLPGEKLPRAWKIAGTTGYDYLAMASGLAVDAKTEAEMTDIYRAFTGDHRSYDEHVLQAKRAILTSSLASEVNMLAQALERIASDDRRSMDFTLRGLTRAIRETIAAFPVYRTYLREDGSREPNDDRHIDLAIRRAQRANNAMPRSIFDFLHDVLKLRNLGRVKDEEKRAITAFAMRFQQVTGPVMAKGVEDTTFYRFVRMISLNEVGGQPSRFGTKTEEFHAASSDRRANWPSSMIATSTHDTKRGEDMRATISVLSEMPAAWRDYLSAVEAISARHVTTADDETMPSRTDQYLFHQTVLGAAGFRFEKPTDDFVRRITAYMDKAAKEEKDETSWVNPNEAYDAALRRYVDGMLRDDAYVLLLRDLSRTIAPHAATNGMAQIALKMASPGVVDTYQGSEDWNFDLVDPDNRRPVDYARLAARLRSLDERSSDRAALAKDLLTRYADGDVKLYITATMMRLRNKHASLFLRGDYLPLGAGDHVVAFARSEGEKRLVCVAPRQTFTVTGGKPAFALGDAWGETRVELPRTGKWTNVLTGRSLEAEGLVPLRELFADFPVAWMAYESTFA